MAHSISPDDRALIERIRATNKVLSLLVFALQEGNVPKGDRRGIADMLTKLADEIREQAPRQANPEPPSNGAPVPLQIEALQGSVST